ncbi:hypothetical protein [Roseibium marinum]|uniref:Uncharacterized protein n=1 Tax=Roseibium marinum TaxID=281252 RepID=A0A2S3ULY4_9HYPH|nr:hypothetical protein [Roseibium marinum]POF28732.1 hypothetical protein CLV41_112148 [Roseibium marinum]
MCRWHTCLPIAFLFSSGALAESAPDPETLITPAVVESVGEWLSNPIVSLSINAQNELRGSLSQADIDALDGQWRKEREADDKPLISATLSAPLSIYLLRVQANSLGLHPEIFVMDANGLNVGQSAITGDYWQGDEDKFQKTFPNGPEAIFIDAAEWDEDLRIWRAQLNLPVTDPETGKVIGAATVEFNLTELQRRQAPNS